MTDRPSHAGEQLAEMGWDQGSTLTISAAHMSFLWVDSSDGGWISGNRALGVADQLVVVSQSCDIIRKPETEPFVEALRAFWTTDKTSIRNARFNSIRHFCLQRRTNQAGVEEGLIADATFRVHLRKDDLLSVTPTDTFASDDPVGRVRFRQWLGARYNRQPIPDHLVFAVQKPIVDAIDKLQPDSPFLAVLEGIAEIIFFADGGLEPYQIELFLIGSEVADPPVRQADADRLAGWMSEQVKKAGKANLDRVELTNLHAMSAYDYATSYQLPLDSYSLPEFAR